MSERRQKVGHLNSSFTKQEYFNYDNRGIHQPHSNDVRSSKALSISREHSQSNSRYSVSSVAQQTQMDRSNTITDFGYLAKYRTTQAN